MPPLDDARKALANRPDGPWRLEPADDGTHRLWAGDPEQLVADRLTDGTGPFLFEMLTALRPIVLELERTHARLELARTMLDDDQRARVDGLLADPEPSDEAKDALRALLADLEPYRDDGTD